MVKKRSKMTIISDICVKIHVRKGIAITPGAMSSRKQITREEGDTSILLSRGQRNLVPGNHGNKVAGPGFPCFPHVSET